ncbi:MAG TPA: hypothetical protein VGR03_12705 [Candidatus Acidoferrum sp.]|nr:hypothetical protein [Candidatus Acidoferrum sp.]
MRRRFCGVLLWLVTGAAALGQPALAGEKSAPKLRQLTAREGRGIAKVADELESAMGRKPDCSHLVHQVYAQAGFPYPYADSLDLYKGWERFLRVPVPQAGDLVVWRGHVGIVMNSREHSFYSSVRSGLRTEFYDSDYWRARGRPRFYRYLAEGVQAARQPRQDSRPPMHPVQAKSATPGTARSETSTAGEMRREMAPETAIHAARKEPMAEEVAEALAERNAAGGEILRAGNPARLVIVYRELRVTDVEIKGKKGTAHVEIDTLASLEGERMESQPGTREFATELRRTKKGWVVTGEKERAYVPGDVAMRILAARLAVLTQDAGKSAQSVREQAQIIRLLNLLIQEN